MIKVDITSDMLSKAESMSKEMGTLKGSFMQGEGNVYGFLGELMFMEVLDDATHDNSYDYDIITKDGLKMDVKTKKTSVEPKPYYECSVSTWNTKQGCDLYGFARVHSSQEYGWVLGTKGKEEFMEEATYYKKGDFDPSNNYRVKSTCYSMAIKELNSI